MRNGPLEKRPPYLPDGFSLDETTDPGTVILRRPGGSEVAAFSAEGADPLEIERAAWEDLGAGAGRGQASEGTGPTEARDVRGTPIRLTRDGLAYGEEFLPLDEVADVRPASHGLWNPGTNLFEVAVVRRGGGPDLAVRDLPLETAERLRGAIADALRERRRRP